METSGVSGQVSGQPFSSLPIWSASAPSDDRVAAVALADVDLDGDLDLACGTSGRIPGTPGRSLLFINRNGSFSNVAEWRSEDARRTLGVALGDINADELHTTSRTSGSRRPHLAGCGLVAHATVRALGDEVVRRPC